MLSVHVVNLHLSQVRGISQPKTVTISNSPTPQVKAQRPDILVGWDAPGEEESVIICSISGPKNPKNYVLQ